MMALLRRYFISGLLVWLPIWVTILALKFLLDILSNSLLLLPKQYQPDAFIGFHIPGIGVAITLLVILGTGLLVTNFLGTRFVAIWDALIARIPIVRTIYAGVKQVTQSVLTPGGHSFRKVCLVEYPHSGTWTIAFQTGDAAAAVAEKLPHEDMVSLYVPTTPNPTSGFLLMVPRNKVIEMNMSVDQALKLVISLGVLQPANSATTIETVTKG